MKHFFTKLMVCALAYTGSAAQADAAAWTGSGTLADPYIVSKIADLEAIESQLPTSNHFMGVYFRQTADIDASGASSSFAGIAQGNDTTYNFAGIYDGGGFAIHNLKIDGVKYDTSGKAVSSGSNTVSGLFGNVGPAGVVKNLTMASDCSFTAFRIVGSIAGKNRGRIENCRNYAPVTAISNYAGGIAAQGIGEQSVITSCYNAGTVKVGLYGGGGIAAGSEGKVTYCQNDGDVLATFVNIYKEAGKQYQAGGIVSTEGQYSYIAFNINTGNVYATYMAGGITSATPTYGASLEGNINYGSITYSYPGTNYIGAIIGTECNRNVSMLNNYFDRQIGYYEGVGTTSHVGVEGLTTAELTSGKPLAGLDSTLYDWQPGLYPVLASFKSEPQAVINRSIIVQQPQTDYNVFYFQNPATLSGATFSLAQGTAFSIAGGKLSVAASADLTTADTLLATVGSYTKRLPLRSVSYGSLFEGEGTEASPYLIKTAADMQTIATLSNTNNINFKGDFFKVVNDIDFGTAVYEPIAVGGSNFQADFDGNGKKIQNVNFTISGSNGYRALFGNVGQHARIHDVVLQSGTLSSYRGTAGIGGKVCGVIDNCENHATITNTKSNGFGGIAGMVWSGGRVSNCRNYADLSVSGTFLGGIAYYVNPEGVVENCVNYGSLSSTKGSVGGIVGENDGRLSGCVNYGDINSSSSLGGIAYTNDYNAVFENCVNYGNVTADSTKAAGNTVGGIVAVTVWTEGTTKTFSGCANYGKLSSKGNLGGIVGRAQPGIVIADCANYGDLRTFDNSTGTMVGGIAGNIETKEGHTNIVKRCFNGGNIVANISYVGGIVGSLNSEISDCYNLGSVSGSSLVGGIAGAAASSTASIKGVYSAGTSTGGNIVGASVGSVADAWYDSSVCSASATDPAAVKGVSTRELTATQISGSYTLTTGMYPTLTSLSDSVAANWFAATVLPAEGESLQQVKTALTIGTPAQTVWTSSDDLSISGNTVTPQGTGAAWLTKTWGNFSRTYQLFLSGGTGIQGTTAQKAVKTVEYYDLNGCRTSQPASGVSVRITRYQDGTTTVSKVLKAGSIN